MKDCKTCHYGTLESVSLNGSPPKIRMVCYFIPHHPNYPSAPCVYWKEAEIGNQK